MKQIQGPPTGFQPIQTFYIFKIPVTPEALAADSSPRDAIGLKNSKQFDRQQVEDRLNKRGKGE